MTVVKLGQAFNFVKLQLDLAEIPELIAAHRRNWEPPDRLEEQGRVLNAEGFPAGPSAQFAIEVIKWGKGHRLLTRFQRENSPERISATLIEALAAADNGRVSLGVEIVRGLSRLGQSFASKLLRFLRPDDAVILDDRIRGDLGYRETQEGYDQFLADCHTILGDAQRAMPALRVCDVEAAIFSKLQGYRRAGAPER
jgi:hypothetical protein